MSEERWPGPKVFISYRRDDTSGHARRIYDRLVQDLGKERVCMDVDTIPFGHDFAEYLERQLAECGYVLAVIGGGWLEARNEHGQRRLDFTDDWVRIELAVALRRGIPVVPVLVDGATPPAKQELPAELEALPRRQALVLTAKGFHHELGGLIQQIRRSDTPSIILHEKTGIELVRIEGGKFLMGAPLDEDGNREGARPLHQVTLSPFWIGKYPVTNEQYARYLRESPKPQEPENWGDPKYNQAKQPVVGVSWEQAVRYAEWAGLRLPTEAEWEYACRAGTDGRYCSGDADDDLDKVGWYASNSGVKLHIVGEKAPNGWGLYDMHGNVNEWCRDWCGEYAAGRQQDPVGPATGSYRIVRGGNWNDSDWFCRSAHRHWYPPGFRLDDLGFRLAADQPR